jgi:hypothetical protein
MTGGRKQQKAAEMFTVMGVSRFALFFRSSKDEDRACSTCGIGYTREKYGYKNR